MNARWFASSITLATGLLLSASAAKASVLDQIAEARTLGIARSLEWVRLMHYRPETGDGPKSEIDGKDFFLSPQGTRDPEAELEATLLAFSAPMTPGHEDAHALCRFPARRLLLESRLHGDARLQGPTCPALTRYESAVDITSVAIIYSANYLNNPASAFGHTFLRLKRRRPEGSTLTPEQLDFGVDYIATTDTKNPLLYAFKGLTGLFPGVFRFHSYEDKIREYGNLEARDLWEYDLALTPWEINLLRLHLWELEATHIDYLYLTKNCSYQILVTLEAIAPRIDLVANLNAVVLPKDTVKALFTVPGLVSDIHYRPSLRSEFRWQVAQLAPRDKAMVERLTHEPDAPFPTEFSPSERIRILETAVLVLDSRFAKPLGSRSASAQVAQAKVVLAARASALSEISTSEPPAPLPRVAAPAERAPERGHASMRVTIGTGTTTQYDNAFLTLGYRLVLHDLADPPDGEPELSQVQFLDTQLRYDVSRSLVTLDRLTFAEVLALNPVTRFERALSWHLQAFGIRLHDRDCPDGFAHGLDGALGATIATEDEHLAFFLMADTYVAFSGALDGIDGSIVRLGVGSYAGLRIRLPLQTLGVVTSTVSYLPGERLHATYDIHAALRSALGKDIALGLEANLEPYSAELQLNSYLYF